MDDQFERHPIKAVIVSAVYFIFLVLSVYLVVNTLLDRFPEMGYIFNNTLNYALMIGIPVAILAGLTAYFDKGEIYRMLFGEGRVALTIIYVIFMSRSLNIGIQEQGISFELTIPGIITLVIIGLVLRGIFYLVEYYVYPEEEEPAQEHEKRVEDPSYY